MLLKGGRTGFLKDGRQLERKRQVCVRTTPPVQAAAGVLTASSLSSIPSSQTSLGLIMFSPLPPCVVVVVVVVKSSRAWRPLPPRCHLKRRAPSPRPPSRRRAALSLFPLPYGRDHQRVRRQGRLEVLRNSRCPLSSLLLVDEAREMREEKEEEREYVCRLTALRRAACSLLGLPQSTDGRTDCLTPSRLSLPPSPKTGHLRSSARSTHSHSSSSSRFTCLAFLFVLFAVSSVSCHLPRLSLRFTCRASLFVLLAVSFSSFYLPRLSFCSIRRVFSLTCFISTREIKSVVARVVCQSARHVS